MNCKEFQIERGLDQNSFRKIDVIKANGNSIDRNDYKYMDATVFRPTQNTFLYRIKIINNDGTSSVFSETVKVKPAVSSVRHTWGSIKALFR